MAKKKWYVVTVGKNIGVFDTWLETASLTKQVPNATFQGFDTEEEAHLAFRKAQEKGTVRIVGVNGFFQSDIRSSAPTIHEDSSRGRPMPVAISQSQQHPQHPSSSRTRPPSPLPIIHANVTYTRGPPSSPTGSSRSSRRTPPRVVVGTPPYLNSYPSDTEETRFQQGGQSSGQPFSSAALVEANSQLFQRVVGRTSPSIKSDHASSGSVSPNRVQAPLTPPIRPTLQFVGPAPISSPPRHCVHTCPQCGPMVPLSRSRTPQSDPRSPILQMTSLTGQFNHLLRGRPSPLTVED